MDHFTNVQDFNALSVHDLLLAREQFHFHLMHKPNVVGTAIGRYRIRKADPWPSKESPHSDTTPRRTHTIRTLENSEVRPYSWPALLVFVDEWVAPDDFTAPDLAVPSAVYLSDGRRVPICVIEAAQAQQRPESEGKWLYPGSLLGGGYPVLCDVQGREHFASVGCLVTDGHRVYALTNRHVAGEAGSTIYSMLNGNKKPIGVSSAKSDTRAPFAELYPGWPGKDTYVNLDVGLIEIEDLNRWTTDVYGLGKIGALANLDISNLSLHLIGCAVRAHGAAGGLMRGEVCAMFYRYKTVGGFEYVADLLIGPKDAASLGTRPGDSGTLWLVDAPGSTEHRACLALQWGGQVFETQAGSQGSSFALATLLSTVCRRLDIDLVRDWNSGNPDYWGAVGHYGIATIAVHLLGKGNLKTLMQANLERISYDVADINKKNLKGLSLLDFVPLADVPDMVWKVGPHKRGGMKSPEHANHFADMDRMLKPPLPQGDTLLTICKKPVNVDVSIWQRYYDAVKKQHPDQEESRGLLPFRVWQIYKAMVGFIQAGEVAQFVCAAGILSHYVGDSCQPLHISYLFNGDPDRPVKGRVRDTENGGTKPGMVPLGKGVHAAYEDDMIDRHVDELIPEVTRLAESAALPKPVKGGQAAAVAVVQLMQATFAKIAPMDLVNAYVALADDKPAARADALWDQFKDDTSQVMADGCRCLAQLWLSAWIEGNGEKNIKDLKAIDEADLAKIYQDVNFLPSKSLDTIKPLLK
jgi:hypothetical protein